MKKLLLATAIAALSVSAANAAPTIYGKGFLTLDLNTGDVDTTTTTYNIDGSVDTVVKSSEDADGRSQLNSNASRIGLKGSEALTANTDLLYQLEYGIDIDAGDRFVDAAGGGRMEKSDQFYSRDTYLGVKNAQYGTLLAGRLTAIDDYVNFANVTQGGVLGGDAVLASFDGPRTNNTFNYFTPSINGMQFMAMYAMDEDNGTDTLGRDAFGLGGKYETGPMNVGATYIQAGDFKVARVSGNYAINPAITLGALYQNTDFDSDDNENAFTISGEMATATPWTAYAQGDFVNNVGGADDAEAFRAVVGGKYAINKATTGHLYGAYLSSESTVTATRVKVENEFDGFGLGGGIEYKF
ncbi:porin [Psychrobacter sp. DAB_AL62B]|uniref:porin n=1 Tax=Psychrobacter sp. DAB_AL62B TaxID=1028420 RepID=UPI002380F865|nr:porin [Psychrobacter sp. DAB_AL62B]MDE4454911.1 porin [Psychrobacter sp. DAB_AL62B]